MKKKSKKLFFFIIYLLKLFSMYTNGLQQKVLEKTIDVFIEKGSEFTMQDIAKELHISKKTLYTLFPSKKDLCISAVCKIYSDITEYKKKILTEDLELLEKIRRFIITVPERYLKFKLQEVSALLKEYPELLYYVQKFRTDYWSPIEMMIKDGQQLGIIREFKIEVYKMMVLSAINSYMQGFFSDVNMNNYELIEEASKFFIYSIVKN